MVSTLMNLQFWGQPLATLLSGLVGGASAVAVMVINKIYERRENHRLMIIEAYSDWAARVWETLSHHENYYHLIWIKSCASQATHPDEKLLEMYKNDVLRVSKLAGEAARNLESSRCKLILLESNIEFQEKISKITGDTEMRELNPQNQVAIYPEYVKRAKTIRAELDEVLKYVAKSRKTV